MSKKQKRSLADPTSLKPRSDDTFQVIIETPKASRNKYSYDPEQGIFTLSCVLIWIASVWWRVNSESSWGRRKAKR